ncbi:MAG: DUF1266 domain-containing protein [Lachnospiraceae bacterium]|nr:DUF1266 domain-containing protein [Lachnospiraceae bacterium]
MKRRARNVIAAAIMLALVLAGCGSKEVVMKEFTSEDETVSIQLNEKWKQEDIGTGAEGWIAAASEDDSEAVMVMQMAKNIYGANVIDMDNWKDMINASYPMSEMTLIDNPSVQGMDVAETYSCTVTIEDISGNGRILYGETEYAYYSILYVAIKMNDAEVEYFNNVCGSFKENAPEIEETSAAESTDTIQWFNNTCAVLTAANRWDYTLFGGAPADENSKSMVQNLLSEWWDVTDHETAEETMDWLLKEGHRVSFAEEMDMLAEAGLADVSEAERVDLILESFDVSEEEAQNYSDWFAFYEQYGSDAAAGWDYSRAMSLLGYYYLAGYYTEEEALDKSLETAEIIQNTFDSWDSLMESYFVGYEYWAEESSDERREIYEEIKAASDSPFQLEWGMAFEKTW